MKGHFIKQKRSVTYLRELCFKSFLQCISKQVSNHIRSFIKIPFMNKGIDFIDLLSIFQDKSVIQSIPIPTSKIQNLLFFVTNITNQSEILFLISINLFLILISLLILLSPKS